LHGGADGRRIDDDERDLRGSVRCFLLWRWPPTGRKVTVSGTFAMQETDPSDFYFQLKDAAFS